MAPKSDIEEKDAADDSDATRVHANASRSHRSSVIMQQTPTSVPATASRSVIAGSITNGSNFGLLRRSRRQTAPNASSHHHHSTTDSSEVGGKPSTMSGHQQQHSGAAVQVMQQPDFSHISALATMALPSLMASYHASMCQQQHQLRLTPRTSTTDDSGAVSSDIAQKPSRLPTPPTATASTHASDLSRSVRGRAVSVSVVAEELLADEYDRLNKTMTPDMEAKALSGDAGDQDYSMFVQSCKLDVAVETAANTRKQLRTLRVTNFVSILNVDVLLCCPAQVGDYTALIGCFVMMMMLEPVGLSSGVFVDPLRRAFNASSFDVSFALSLQLGGLLAVSPLDNWLNIRFGMQTVLMFGAAISALSFLLTALLATQIWHFYIGYGFFGGLALGMAEYSLIAGSAFMFPGRADLLALICVGVSVGNIAIPPILSKVIDACDAPIAVYVNETMSTTVSSAQMPLSTASSSVAQTLSSGSGWRGGLFVVAAAQVLVIMLALTFRVPEERFFHPPPALVAASSKNFFPKCIYNKPFAVLATYFFFWIMHMQFFSYGPSIIQGAVQDDSINSGVILSVYSVAQLCGRLVTVYINTKPLSISLRAYTTAGTVAVMGVCLIILALLVDATSKFVVFCIPVAIAGCCSGIVWASFSWIMLEVFGPFQFGSAVNFVNPSGGASNYIGIFVGGYMATKTGKPEAPLFLAGAGLLVASAILSVLALIQRRRQIADYAPPAKHVMLESAGSTDEMLYGSRESLSASRRLAADRAEKTKSSLVEEIEEVLSPAPPPNEARLPNQSVESIVVHPRETFFHKIKSLFAGSSREECSAGDRLDSVLVGDHRKRPWRIFAARDATAQHDEFVLSTENAQRPTLAQSSAAKCSYNSLDPEPAIRLLVENNRNVWDRNHSGAPISSRASRSQELKLSWMRSNYGLFDQNSSDTMIGRRGRQYRNASSSTELLPKDSSFENFNYRGDNVSFD